MNEPNTLNKFTIPIEVSDVCKTLENANFKAYLVGGCVRDLVIGIKPKDWDITTNAKPENIISLFPKTFYENIYGTVGIVSEVPSDPSLKIIEVTPFRIEHEYSNNRHPDKVTFSDKIEDDLKRRDFTINALALEIDAIEAPLFKGQIVDLFKGQPDILSKTIRTVGVPEDRFREDALRMLRAIRIASELGFTINIDTKTAIIKNSSLIKEISFERIRDEFIRIIMSDRPMEGVILAHELGLLEHFVPELVKCIGVKQNKAHSFDVWEHILRSLQHSVTKKYPLHVRLAALFHDISKPETRRWSDEKKEWTFYGHDVVGERVTKNILARLKFPKKTIDTVAKLVRWHMFFSDTEQITLSSVRRLITNVGTDLIWDLMNVRICDRIGTGRPKESPYRLRKFKSMIEEVMHDPISVGMLKIDGNSLIKVTGLNPSPKIGFILHALLEEVLENPKLNTEDYLKNRAIELAKLNDEDLKKIGIEAKKTKDTAEEENLKSIREKYWVK